MYIFFDAALIIFIWNGWNYQTVIFSMFFIPDTNGDDFLDTSELEALFIKEVSDTLA